MDSYSKTTGEQIRSIQRIEKPQPNRAPRTRDQSPVDFRAQRGQIEVDRTHPLLQPLFRRKRYAPLVEKLVVAFERSNEEGSATKRRELFYKLLSEIFANL